MFFSLFFSYSHKYKGRLSRSAAKSKKQPLQAAMISVMRDVKVSLWIWQVVQYKWSRRSDQSRACSKARKERACTLVNTLVLLLRGTFYPETSETLFHCQGTTTLFFDRRRKVEREAGRARAACTAFLSSLSLKEGVTRKEL
jgi:hypothetical protein